MPSICPFPADPDRAQIWKMLVPRDIAAYVAGDFDRVAGDFLPEEFLGVDAGRSTDPRDWRLAYPTLESYRAEWLRQSASDAATGWAEDLEAAIHRNTRLEHIEIAGDRALARKEFLGDLHRADGGVVRMEWMTIYHCKRVEKRWRICGFTGYLPHPAAG
ncbi:nuclear transport factor 2 family protein [Pseudooceanicola sp. CBS1P-1]|uniref:SnoaL-like domain-containing protein n=1 Tax=Pseudooceanicola albus TaxID=2692189 RepID=A0A6L7G756_9RHOB|nr:MULTISPECIES: hypothetical protein [Pseudooceanicola]MBT9385205.1 nuclear transport factor 2 family protein [Pseudooceanicola endophyticus]MXN18503.1 hypothetical protein [Pseudooceanicola albus]